MKRDIISVKEKERKISTYYNFCFNKTINKFVILYEISPDNTIHISDNVIRFL